MKKLITLSALLGWSIQVDAQCTVQAFTDPDTITCGQCATLSAFGSASGNVAFQEDFNSGSPVGWSFTQAVTIANTINCPGSTPIPPADGTDFMWMGDASVNPRDMETVPFDLTLGGTICFDMIFSEQGNASPCEGPDEPDEGVYLEYSTDGGLTWQTINYFDPQGGYNTPYLNWNTYCFPIPPGAMTANTMIRWHQDAVSGAEYDHWGIDNVVITLNDPNYNITWVHDSYSYGLGNPGGDNPTDVCPTTTTTYTVNMTDGTNTCSATVEVVVEDPNIIIDAGNDTTICAGDCFNLNGTAYELVSPASTPTFENSQFEVVASGHAEMNINVQGLNTTSMTSSSITSVCINGFNFSGTQICTNFGGCPCGGSTVAFGGTCNLDISSFNVTLVSPTGCSILLVPLGTATGTDYNNVCFVPAGTPQGGGFPVGGPWAPNDPFSNMNGCDPNGVWTLEFDAPGGLGFGIGTFFGWSISFDDPELTNPVNYVWTGANTGSLTDVNDLNTNTCPTTPAVGTETYTLEATDLNGCTTVTDDIVVTIDNCCALTIDAVTPTDATCGASDGQIDVTVSGQTTGLVFSLDNGVTTQASNIFTGLPAGNYTVWVNDDNGCIVTQAVVIGTAGSAADPTFTFADFCEGGTNGPAGIVTPGGTFAFNPNPGGGVTIDPSTGVISGAVGGTTLDVEYTTPGACPGTLIVSVNVLPGPSFSLASTNPTACGLSDGTITISGLTASSNYNLTYDGPGGTVGPNAVTTDASGNIVITGLGAGSYTNFTVEQAGCSTTDNSTLSLNEPGAPVVTAGSDLTVCEGSTVTLNAVPSSGTVSWDNGVTNNTPFTATVVGQTTYTVTADDNGCTASDQMILTVNPLPVFTVTPVDAACGAPDGQLIIGGLQANTTYTLTYQDASNTYGPASMTTDASGDIIITGLPAATYFGFIVVDAAGCQDNQPGPFAIASSGGVAFTIQGSTDPSGCGLSDGTITLSGFTASGVYNVSYDNGSGTQGPTSMTADASGNIVITGLPSGTYSNFVAEQSGCSSSEPGPVTLTDPGAPTVDAGADQTVCEGDAVTLTAVISTGTVTWNNSVVDGTPFTPAVGVVTYTATVDDGMGCTNSDQVTVTVNAAPSFTLSYTDPTACAATDGAITISGLTSSTAYSVSYDDATGTQGPTSMTSTGSGTITITGLSAGSYSNFTLELNGCSTTDPSVIVLTDPNNATAQFTSPDTIIICQGDSALIEIALTGSAPWTLDYLVNGLPGPQIAGITNSTISFYTSVGGTYSLTAVSEAGGCVGTILGNDVFVFQVPKPPAPTITGVGTYCGDAIIPHLIAQGTGGNIQWFYDSTLSIFAADGDTLYNVHYDNPGIYDFWAVESFYGCPGDSVKATVTILDPGFIDLEDTIHICLGDEVTLSPVSSDTLYWNGPGGSLFGDITISPELDTVMLGWMNTECGMVNYPVWVFVHPIPFVDAGPDQIIALHEVAQLNASASDTITWTPSTTLSCAHCLDPVSAPLESTEYIITATSEYGCTESDTVYVIIEGEWEIYVPNVFSPNDDGWNDDVHVQGPPLEGYSFTIYNRWGEKLFESRDMTDRWDGTWRNKPAGQGVYVYMLRATISTTNTVVEQSGNITLVR